MFKLFSQIIPGVTLDDYRKETEEVREELHDEIAEAIEDLRKSQEMLDQIKSEVVSNFNCS